MTDCGCPMGHKRPHGSKGGPGRRMKEHVVAAMRRACPTCKAVPGERCIRNRWSGSTFRSRPDLGRRFFEMVPSKSHRDRFRPAPGERRLPKNFQNVTLEQGIIALWRSRGVEVKSIRYDGKEHTWTVAGA